MSNLQYRSLSLSLSGSSLLTRAALALTLSIPSTIICPCHTQFGPSVLSLSVTCSVSLVLGRVFRSASQVPGVLPQKIGTSTSSYGVMAPFLRILRYLKSGPGSALRASHIGFSKHFPCQPGKDCDSLSQTRLMGLPYMPIRPGVVEVGVNVDIPRI